MLLGLNNLPYRQKEGSIGTCMYVRMHLSHVKRATRIWTRRPFYVHLSSDDQFTSSWWHLLSVLKWTLTRPRPTTVRFASSAECHLLSLAWLIAHDIHYLMFLITPTSTVVLCHRIWSPYSCDFGRVWNCRYHVAHHGRHCRRQTTEGIGYVRASQPMTNILDNLHTR